MMAMRGCFGKDGFPRAADLTAIEAQSQGTEASKHRTSRSSSLPIESQFGKNRSHFETTERRRLPDGRPGTGDTTGWFSVASIRVTLPCHSNE